MAVTYTTAALVRKRISQISTDLSDSDIENFILDAEGIIDAVMMKSFKTTFDATKHGLIRDTATTLAAFFCLIYDVNQFSSNSAAALTADLLWAEFDRNLAVLSDDRVKRYLESLG
jgi:hypothetical protein